MYIKDFQWFLHIYRYQCKAPSNTCIYLECINIITYQAPANNCENFATTIAITYPYLGSCNPTRCNINTSIAHYISSVFSTTTCAWSSTRYFSSKNFWMCYVSTNYTTTMHQNGSSMTFGNLRWFWLTFHYQILNPWCMIFLLHIL